MTLCHIDLELDGGADHLQARIVGAIPAADVVGIMAAVTRAILAGQQSAAAPEAETAPVGPALKPARPAAPAAETRSAAKLQHGPRPDGRVTVHGYAKLRGLNPGNVRGRHGHALAAIATDGLLDPVEADRVIIAHTKPDTQIGRIVRQAAGVADEPDGRLTPYEYGRLRGSASSVYRLSAELGPILVDGRLDPHEADQLLAGLTKPASALGQAVRQALREVSAAKPAEVEILIEPEPPAEEAAPVPLDSGSPEGTRETQTPSHPGRETQAAPALRPNGQGGKQPIEVVAQAAARWLSARGDMCKRPYPATAPRCWRGGKQEIDEAALIEMARQKGAVLPEVMLP